MQELRLLEMRVKASEYRPGTWKKPPSLSVRRAWNVAGALSSASVLGSAETEEFSVPIP